MISANIDRIGSTLRRQYLAKQARKRRAASELSQKRDALIDKIINGRSKTANVVVHEGVTFLPKSSIPDLAKVGG